MVTIKIFKVLSDKKINFVFSDGTEKTIDFAHFIGNDSLTKQLSDPVFFKEVALYQNGRGIYWPNEYDFCPDFLLHYQPDKKELEIRN